MPIICPRCGKEVEPGRKFCLSCGAAMRDLPGIPCCQACGSVARAQDRFCLGCGGKVTIKPAAPAAVTAAPAFCRKCGAKLADGAKFCRACGAKAGTQVAAPPPSAVAPAPPAATPPPPAVAPAPSVAPAAPKPAAAAPKVEASAAAAKPASVRPAELIAGKPTPVKAAAPVTPLTVATPAPKPAPQPPAKPPAAEPIRKAPAAQGPTPKPAETGPRGRTGRWVALGGIAAVLVAVAGVGIYMIATPLGPVGPGDGGGSGSAGQTEQAVAPVTFDAAMQKAILAMPEFRTPAATGTAGAKGAAAGGKLDLVEQTSRASGEHVLHVWTDTQKPGLRGQTVDVRVLMEVWLDASGKPVQAREIGQKDPDLLAFEKALDNAKM